MKRPLKVLSASIGIMLVSHMLLLSAHAVESPNPSAAGAGSSKLVEWSSEDVKAYYDPSVDWSLPVPVLSDNKASSPSPSPTPAAGGSSTSSGGSTTPIIVNQVTGGGGFGWDDLLLYHLIFNTVSPYSSSSWGSNHRSYHYRSNTPYVTKTYQPNSFSNRSTTKTPTTSSGTGSFTTNKSSSNSTSGGTTSSSKSTSTSSGSIGGKSSGFSSSSSSSSGG
ncbi:MULTISPECIES: hypothetical protein [unclassified Paenibacillus]|uniref:hypothetical protein n=1 Tax=unclassified Paenibacillus TaxID=185978 RepID=UPI00070D1221|nr:MULTISPECIES: hypothetical protein [unclassified Paenibacillus]KQX45846.1 hypothetical protein ASD40_18570 [Paenibacillus sp. Root444D2]KRE50800.1 hypothetical protein ASG85_19775 [Paenibacillus sp. Soil724D2]